MPISRRSALQLLASLPAAALPPVGRAIAAPRFEPRWDSLQHYSCPEWYRNAKFGIYFHWGLYSVPAFGNEWYPHWMYLPGRAEYDYHLKTYGPLDKFGYKDFAPMFTAEHFDADAWVAIFKDAGARYVGPVAEHADGFSMWDSRINRWNAARMGPRRDIVGLMERAVRKQGLKFYTSFHHQWLWGWYTSPQVNADIYNPEFADLYWPHKFQGSSTLNQYNLNDPGAFNYAHPDPPPTARFCELWRDKVIEVVDRYHPDVVYFDTRCFIIPEAYRMQMMAHYYNSKPDVVLTYKEKDFAEGSGLIDIEAGQLTDKASFVWQTDDVIDWESWGYIQKPSYKSPGRIIHQLIDVVSKNGNMLLDVGPRPDGTIPEEVQRRLKTIGAWLRTNGEAIYDSRPAFRFGEGPTKIKEGSYVADRNSDFGAQDIRFTTRNGSFYVHVLGAPGSEIHVASLRRDTPLPGGPLRDARMLGIDKALQWQWSPDGLVIHMPEQRPSDDAVVVKLS